MKSTIIILSIISLLIGETVQTGVNINGAPGNYSINTADNYSWQTRTKVFKFQHTKVEEISHILKECLSEYGKIQINDQMNMVVITEEENKLQNIIELCASLDVDDMKEFVKIQTETINLNYTVPSEIQTYLLNYLSIDGSIQSYDDLNLLIIHDHDDIITRVKKEIKKFDISPKEIRINFDVVEVLNSNFKDNGVNWDELFSVVSANAGWNFRRGSENSDASSNSNTSQGTGTNSSSSSEQSDGSWDFNGGVTLSTHNFKNFMRFMVDDGSANYVSNNSLSILNNHKAVFYYTYNASSVRVEIIPNLINSKTVKINLNLSVDNSVIYETTVYSKIGEVKKVVSFQNIDSTENTKKVPGLGTILPFLFSRKNKGKQDVKLDIVMTTSL